MLHPFILIAGLLGGCKGDSGEAPPNLDPAGVKFQIRRFEQELFEADTSAFSAALGEMRAKDPEFASLYFQEILGAGDPRIAPQGEEAYLKGFIVFKKARDLYWRVQKKYGDFSPFEKAFTNSLRLFHHYFPTQPVPRLTTYLSEFSLGNFIYGDNRLAVGLDFYLGPGYPYQAENPQNPNFSAYLTRSFNADHLVCRTLQPLVNDLLPPPDREDLLSLIIHEGKKLYLLDLLQPGTPDSVIMEVSGAQAKWLEANEREIFSFFVQESLLYASDWQKIRKYVDYSPHSPGMPAAAPGRTGSWLGWQIVSAWMARHPDATPADLVKPGDSRLFFNDSAYRPPRN